MPENKIFVQNWSDYELLDAGGGKKLERWGNTITIRPELQAYFKSCWAFDKWYELAHWEFLQAPSKKGVSSTQKKLGNWKQLKTTAPRKWEISYKKLRFHLELTAFKHLGLFPEQSANWEYITQNLPSDGKFLNLFAYTGAASLIARNIGAETIHVDSVRQIISWANSNMEASRLLNIKWVLDDALKFAEREVKRGNKYHGIIMDPPAWGLGLNGERWKIEEKIDSLLAVARELMEEKGFLIVNTYTPQIDVKMLISLSKIYFQEHKVEVRELWMKTTTGKELFFGNVMRIKSIGD